MFPAYGLQLERVDADFAEGQLAPVVLADELDRLAADDAGRGVEAEEGVDARQHQHDGCGPDKLGLQEKEVGQDDQSQRGGHGQQIIGRGVGQRQQSGQVGTEQTKGEGLLHRIGDGRCGSASITRCGGGRVFPLA